jgi:hypothetical protein
MTANNVVPLRAPVLVARRKRGPPATLLLFRPRDAARLPQPSAPPGIDTNIRSEKRLVPLS